MSWCYKIRRRLIKGDPWFDIVEYYPSQEKHCGGWTVDSIVPEAETPEGVVQILKHMLDDAGEDIRHNSILIEEDNAQD